MTLRILANHYDVRTKLAREILAELRKRLADGSFGTLEHVEATMTGPAGLSLPAEQWRANAEETPVGGLTPMGVHLIDLMIDLFGEIDEAYCQSFRRAVPNDTDDTSTMVAPCSTSRFMNW